MSRVVTFDAGETLVELDLDFLAARLASRGVTCEPRALRTRLRAAWAHHDALGDVGHEARWRGLMATLLGCATDDDAVSWLWREQPRANLWRKPIAGVVAVAGELAARGVTVGVISNSEGTIAELLASVGIACGEVIDSGVVGVAKPDPRIFELALARFGGGCAPRDAIHVGDAWAADVEGALAAGWRAVWYGPRVMACARDGVFVARDPSELADVLWAEVSR
nr:HAD family hydrolase [Kofleriaceae bacterium]